MSTRRSDFGRLAQVRVSDTMHKADVTLQEGGPRKAGAVLCAIPGKGQPKGPCEMTGCRVQQRQAGLPEVDTAPGSRGESGVDRAWAGRSSGWLGSATYTPEKSSQQASQGDRQQQVRIFALALGLDLTLHYLISLPRGPSAGLVVSKRGQHVCGAQTGGADGAHGHTTAHKPQGPSLLTGSATQG